MNRRAAAGPRPFLKWAGGKGALLEAYAPLFPPPGAFRRYFEPFLGGGAVFFKLLPSDALLSDLNAELINAYRQVQRRVEELIPLLKEHERLHCREHYYEVRSLSPSSLSPLARAARFIYLNRTCYNGLYRENSKGCFNVPMGRYRNPQVCQDGLLREVSRALQGVELRTLSFERIGKFVRRGDFIYLDPPYRPISQTSSFTGYSKEGFGDGEQRRLAAFFRRMDAEGALLMLSNSDHPFIRELYEDFLVLTVEAPRSINSRADRRGKVRELVILNYEPPGTRWKGEGKWKEEN